MKTRKRTIAMLLTLAMAVSLCTMAAGAAAQTPDALPPCREDAGTITYGLELYKIDGKTAAPVEDESLLQPGDVVEVHVAFGTDFYAEAVNSLVLFDTRCFTPYGNGATLKTPDHAPFQSGVFTTYPDDVPTVTLASGSTGTFYDTLSASYGLLGTTNDKSALYVNSYLPLYMRAGYADGTATMTSPAAPEYADIGFMFASFIAGKDSALHGERMKVPYATYYSFRLQVNADADTEGETTAIFVPVLAQRTGDSALDSVNCLCGYTADRAEYAGAQILRWGQGIQAQNGRRAVYIGHGPHQWDNGNVTTPATCDTDGVRTFTCLTCGKQKTEAVPAVGHVYLEAERAEAVCDADGYILYRCARDGRHTYTEVLPALGHDWDAPEVIRQPTCLEQGENSQTCRRCGVTVTVPVATLQHVWGESVVVEASTCSTHGSQKRICTLCGVDIYTSLPYADHTWDDGVVTRAPACGKLGEIEYTCTQCGKTKTQYLPAIQHVWDDGVVTTDTCKERIMTFTCQNCGVTRTRQLATVIEHTWDEGIVTKEPTETETGTRAFSCLVCGTMEYETIPKLSASADGLFLVTGGKVRPGDTVQVTVSVRNNPGFAAALLYISYNKNVLTLLSAQDGGLLGNGAFSAGEDLTAVPYTVLWVDALATENHTADGVLVTLTFRVANNAPEGPTPVTVAYDAASTIDVGLTPVPFTVQNGALLVTNRAAGDADGDGEITLKDATLLRRFLAGWDVTIDVDAADVDGSGTLTLADVILLMRFLAGGWNVTLQ